jgi:predicted RNA-binding protein (virulence factor B family)
MAFLGRYNKLRIVKRADIGAFLDGDQFGDILLPRKYAPESMRIGDKVEVFLYNDSEDRIIATTLAPRVQVGKCAYLKVVATGKYGAFLDWGLPKDLLVPFSEQQNPMQKGYSYTVYVFVDEETQRIAASFQTAPAGRFTDLRQKRPGFQGSDQRYSSRATVRGRNVSTIALW